jgi:hypothetical protein
MDKEDVFYIHNGIFNQSWEMNGIVPFREWGRTGGPYVKQNRSNTERQIPHIITHLWKLKC